MAQRVQSFRKGCNLPCDPRFSINLVSVTPALGLVVDAALPVAFTLVFDRPVNPATIISANIFLTGPGTGGPAPAGGPLVPITAFTLSPDGMTITFSTMVPLSPGFYTMNVTSGVKAANMPIQGNAIMYGCPFKGQAWTIPVTQQPSCVCDIPGVPENNRISRGSEFNSLVDFDTFLHDSGGFSTQGVGQVTLSTFDTEDSGVGSIQIARQTTFLNPFAEKQAGRPWCFCTKLMPDSENFAASFSNVPVGAGSAIWFGFMGTNEVGGILQPGVFVEIRRSIIDETFVFVERIVIVNSVGNVVTSPFVTTIPVFHDWKLCYRASDDTLVLTEDGNQVNSLVVGSDFDNLNVSLPESFTAYAATDGFSGKATMVVDSYCASRVQQA